MAARGRRRSHRPILKVRAPRSSKLRASRRIRRRSSCGRSFAISSTTAPFISEAIADNARDVDLAIRWGFGWQRVRSRPGRRRAGSDRGVDCGGHRGGQGAGQRRRCPAWVTTSPVADDGRRAHAARRVLAERSKFVPRSDAARLSAAAVPRSAAGETAPIRHGKTIFETDAVRVWHPRRGRCRHRLVQEQDEHDRRRRARRPLARHRTRREDYTGVVIWQPTSSSWQRAAVLAGRESREAMPAFMTGGAKGIEPFVAKFQQGSCAEVRLVPTVRGARHRARRRLRIHHASRSAWRTRVVHRPGGGRRRSGACGRRLQGVRVARSGSGERRQRNQSIFRSSCGSTSRMRDGDGRERAGGEGDGLPAAIGHDRLQRPRAAVRREDGSARAGRIGLPSAAARAADPGRGPHGHLRRSMLLVNMRDGGFISAYDFGSGAHGAAVCGGEVDAGSLVDEDWLLKLERQAFMRLAGTQQDAGAHRAYAGDRQAAAQLSARNIGGGHDETTAGCLHRRRDAHAVGKAPRGVFRTRGRTRCSPTCSAGAGAGARDSTRRGSRT